MPVIIKLVKYHLEKWHAYFVITIKSGVTETHLCQHDEPHEKWHHSHCQDEELPTVFTAEGGGIHVHHGRHQAFHTHKLVGRKTRSVRYLYKCFCMRVHVSICDCWPIQKSIPVKFVPVQQELCLYYCTTWILSLCICVVVVHMLVSLDCPVPGRLS